MPRNLLYGANMSKDLHLFDNLTHGLNLAIALSYTGMIKRRKFSQIFTKPHLFIKGNFRLTLWRHLNGGLNAWFVKFQLKKIANKILLELLGNDNQIKR